MKVIDMKCPRCFGTDITLVGTTHYICNNENCVNDNNRRTQFKVINDDKLYFPYNQIFINHSKTDFYRKEYLKN